MLIYTTVTPPFESLVSRWLAPSLARLGELDRLVVVIDHTDGARGNGDFRSSGFDAHIVNKLQFIADRASDSERPFLITDADVLYLQPFAQLFQELMGQRDLLLAREYPGNAEHYNIGQMVIRPSAETEAFFRTLASEICQGRPLTNYRRDRPANQEYLNEQLRKSVLNHAPMPESFANTGLLRHVSDETTLHSYHATESLPRPGISSLEQKHRHFERIVSRMGIQFEGPYVSASN
jgi:hypothetical protein